MELGMVGLGKMGLNMATRLLKGGHRVVAFDVNSDAVASAIQAGAVGVYTLDDLVSALSAPRAIWVMVPAGKVTEDTLQNLAGRLKAGDVLIDGGNSNYKDSQRRAAELEARGLNFLDVGTSGGVWGLKEGYSLMIGGQAAVVERLSPIFKTLAPDAERGWGHVGPSGAGHFVKMVHNGIEYGLMQAYAEGFEIMKKKEELNLKLSQIAEIWRYGSVVRSWLLDLTSRVLEQDEELSDIRPWVTDSGEGRWTVAEAVDLDVPAPVITLALQARLASRNEENYTARLLAAMRNQFGGHAIKHRDGKGGSHE
ncbi:MAG: decarboxylating 6-phosphogluconate dehydrogenase [Anaerolineae bacterium]|nr:decarboxylating 6-phosphogluconate dehydrogenase [Anaerolineae bacterium]